MAGLFRNTLAVAASSLSSQFFSFLLAPIMIARLGLTLFGVWTVVGAVVIYATILDAGLTRALARFVALYDARSDPTAIRECIGLGLIAFTAIGLVLVPTAWLAGPPLAAALGHVSDGQMRQILLASAAIFIVQGYSAVLQALPQGLRRMLAPNAAVVAGNTVNFAASVGALVASRSLVPYAWANAAAEALSALFVLVSVRYVWRSRMAAVPSRERVREVLGFSLQSQLGWIADLINLQSDKIVLGLIVGPRAAGVYQVASSVAAAVRSVGVISISAIIPSATAMIAGEGRAVVRRLALHYAPRALGVSLPIFALTALTAPFLFSVWIHRATHAEVPILIALNAAYAVNIATGVPSTLSIADNRPGFVSRNSLQMAALNLVLTLALAPAFGLAGVVAGTVVAVGGVSAVFIVSFARSYGIDAVELRAAIVRPAALATAVALPFIPLVLVSHHLAGSRLSAGALLFGFAAGYGALYWPLASRIGVLPQRLVLRRALSRSAA
jgi:O-antigen/teichoic acid export membrane protein